MNKATKKEILEVIEKLAEEHGIYLSSVESVTVNFVKESDKEILFEVTQMYDNPLKNNFKYLKAFSELFGTDNIDIYDDISRSGCESCDYGSSYGYAIRVWK